MKQAVIYPAIFKPVEKDIYFISFPDVPSAVTEGHGLKDSFEMASDALATMLYDEKKLPKVTNPKDIQTDGDSFVALVSADLSQAADNFA
ncbi:MULTISPECIES: type II toxin-antitoxin system HicB family antitoxin [Lactobacillus]|uniref:Type II toxin-antitoxin system HicB family antitoxin n=1 Tax=Lactobacillus xujianguonis TaxID=2495899 RepID=A0A437SSM4_9LACO|nr:MULTISPECIES: type II toxin-antitoxin system HicB family antitoxin [Lactobacillus]RVU69895.1 type II toxin-antitoxin system HicB family antitoxin [Lactobacillus xujianguonis]RVU73492.1 type II toxin-antitoxin system HicB family antitoxin [Lactobacillus xujianguonis]